MLCFRILNCVYRKLHFRGFKWWHVKCRVLINKTWEMEAQKIIYHFQYTLWPCLPSVFLSLHDQAVETKKGTRTPCPLFLDRSQLSSLCRLTRPRWDPPPSRRGWSSPSSAAPATGQRPSESSIPSLLTLPPLKTSGTTKCLCTWAIYLHSYDRQCQALLIWAEMDQFDLVL